MRKLTLFYVDWLLLLVLVLVVGCFLCGTARMALGSEVSPWRIRVAAAIAIHNANRLANQTQPNNPAQTKPVVTPHQRPVVKMYSATLCVPCQRAKAELQKQRLPFDLQVIDVSQGGQPDWCDAIPAFAWQVRGQTRYVLGFPGVAQLIGSWQATQDEKAESAGKPTTSSSTLTEVP